jgi:predicted Zn-dependent protease
VTSLGTHRLELNRSRIDGAGMFYAVVLHELGHFFGLGHTDDESALMFGCYVGNDEITASDLEAFENLYPIEGSN